MVPEFTALSFLEKFEGQVHLVLPVSLTVQGFEVRGGDQ